MNPASLLNPDFDFFDQASRRHLFLQMSNRMSMHQKVSTVIILFAEDVGDNRRQFNLSRSDKDYINFILKEAFVSFMVNEALFLDVGKIDIKSGVTFFRNPAQLISNPLHLARKGRISNSASAQSDPYREGSLMFKTEYYTSSGTFTAAFIPRIISPSEKAEITEQNVLERVNSKNMGLLKWRLMSTGNFNPELVLLIGNRVGASGALSVEKGSVIFNLEGSLANHSPVCITSEEAQNKIRTFSFPLPPVENFFIQRDCQVFYMEAMAGFNYRNFKRKYNIIAEYYYNQAGFSRSEWEEYFSFLNLLNDYSNRISPLYKNGIGIFAEESRRLACENVLSGRHYLCTRQEMDDLFLKDVSVCLNYMISLSDFSGLVDVHAEYRLSGRGWKILAGYWTTTGGRETEFGVQMVKNGIYMGVTYLW